MRRGYTRREEEFLARLPVIRRRPGRSYWVTGWHPDLLPRVSRSYTG